MLKRSGLLLVLFLFVQTLNIWITEAGSSKATKSGSTFDKDVQRRRNECASNQSIMEPCIQEEVDEENCILKCVSQKCYNELFPEPIEDGEVISSQNIRLKRCLREEVKVQRAAEAQREKERKRGDVL
ncbi:hypothetical protein DUNSADRAFT_5494 [Dunaliella salina]|uniref:Encoded protein n=1 Tax=Dunaliella salina TaxID=3046 RepID=A0ABQ7H7A1_DUNSA|nr:hypothetical protein DUNSADRAFT_5494 [Dunaliella salina]|eukprot:KAF5842727.1 hypothetical protein DUNSADRAFT_5494 [Dunaliella salina]